MTNARRFRLDELTLRPGTYFNPQTEIMIVVDDSPEVDHELFDMDEFDSDEWVLIAEDIPVDESRRDDLVERFQRTYQDADAMVPKDEGDPSRTWTSTLTRTTTSATSTRKRKRTSSTGWSSNTSSRGGAGWLTLAVELLFSGDQ